MKKIDISEKEYMVMMMFIHIVVYEDKFVRWNLQGYLAEHVKSEEEFDFLYECILDLNMKELEKLAPRERIILLKFVGTILVTWKKDSMFADLCCENGISFMKMAYIAFNAGNIERVESYEDVAND